MNRNELLELYEKACRGIRQDPEEAEFQIWMLVLGGFEFTEVDAALRSWWASENGRFLPQPCDLKPMAEANARIRLKLKTPDFCKNSGLGVVMKLAHGELIRARCECGECARAWEWRDSQGEGGRGLKSSSPIESRPCP